MKKIEYKIKILGYKMITILLYLFPIETIYKIFNTNIQIGDKIGSSIVIVITSIIMIILLKLIFGLYILDINKLFKMPKIIYHENLGYFSGYFSDSKIHLYKQNIFSLSYINSINIEDTTQIQNDIKNILDAKYQKSLNLKRNREVSKSKKDLVKGWDGYLSTRERRDGKINKLLRR